MRTLPTNTVMIPWEWKKIMILQAVLNVEILTILTCFYMLARNQWVYVVRGRLIDKKPYNPNWKYEYCTYEEMMYKKVFCFDVEKFRIK